MKATKATKANSDLQAPPQKACIACAELIQPSARVCIKCGSHQRRWKSHLQFAATVSGVIAGIAAALVYVVTELPDIRETLAWHTDVRVISFSSTRDIAVLNAGDGPVFVSHVALQIQGVGTQTLHINQLVERSKIAQQRFGLPAAIAPPAGYELVNHATADEWRSLVKLARLAGRERCVFASVFSNDDPDYQLYMESDARDPHVTPQLRAVATLHFYDLKSGQGEKSIPAHALLFKRTKC